MKDIENEIPFDLPEGWTWCRLGEVINIKSGDAIKVRENQSGKYPIYGGNGITGYYSEFNIEIPTIIIGRVGFNCGSIHIAKEKSWITDNAFITIFNPSCCDLIFLSFALQYLNLSSYSNSTAQPVISSKSIYPILFPLPPLAEQQRIVSAIEAIFAQIDLLEQNKADLQTAIEQAKRKILDLAIHGKLVLQAPADEPASVMLERLRAEKEAKIAAGEIKRNKNDSYIYKNPTDNCYYEKFFGKNEICIDNEIPFELPESWQWCRFGNYIDIRDGTHDSPKYVETGYPFITSKNLINGKLDFSNVQYITEADHNNYIQRSYVEDDDILFAMIGSIGNPVLIKKDREFSIKNVALFKPYEKKHTDMKFVLFFLSWIQEDLRKIAKGGMQPFIPLNLFRKEIFIPLPPISEQKRIVSKIKDMFTMLDKIQNNLV